MSAIPVRKLVVAACKALGAQGVAPRDCVKWHQFLFRETLGTEPTDPLAGTQWFSCDFSITTIENQTYLNDTQETGMIMLIFSGRPGRGSENVQWFAERIKRVILGGYPGSPLPAPDGTKPSFSQWKAGDQGNPAVAPSYGLSVPGVIDFRDFGLSDGDEAAGIYTYTMTLEYEFQASGAQQLFAIADDIAHNGIAKYLSEL